MAILKSLLVQGPSRFLSTSYYNTIVANGVEADSIETNDFEANAIVAEKGIFTKLNASDVKATNLTVVGLLNTAGELHTTNWTNTNIASIEGSFSIIPTIGSSSGTVNVNPTAESLSFFGTSYAVDSLYTGDSTGAGNVNWTNGSKVIVTGEILVDGEYISLGTLRGTLGDVTTTTINIQGIRDNTNSTAEILTTIGSQTGATYRNLKISLYERADSSNSYPIGIYLTALGANGKTFIDIYGGRQATSTAIGGGLASPVVRIGNLEGLAAIAGVTPAGWGIYTSNGFFSGTVAAMQGKIGSGTAIWTIGSDGNNRSYIYSGITNITTSGSTTGIYVGTNGISNYASTTQYVNLTGGKITAQGADIAGKITASEGKIGPWFINASSISKNSDGTAAGSYNTASNIYFGTSGLSLGTTFKVNEAGELTATSGTIGGWSIDTNALYYGNKTPGATTTNLVLSPTSGTNSNAIGGSSTNLTWFLSAGQVFGVTTAGALYSTSGKIGGWDITASSIQTGTFNTSGTMYFGSSGISLSNTFKVSSTGVLTASGVDVTGKITATSGVIGGWRIGTDDKKSLHNGIYDTSPTPASGTVILSKGITTTSTIGNLPAATYAITAGTTFGVTTDGILYADGAVLTNITLSDYATETYASTVASNERSKYITVLNQYGIQIHPSTWSTAEGNSNANYLTLNGDGLNIYKGGTSVALYGETARIGPIKYGFSRVELSGLGFDFKRQTGTTASNYTILAHIGYDSGNNASGGTSDAPYFTFGTRKNGTIGNYSLSGGTNNIASGYASHAEGEETEASGRCSHTEGINTFTSNAGTHAEGYGTTTTKKITASGMGAHAEGYAYSRGIQASGHGSHAEGEGTIASGDASHAGGTGTTAVTRSQTTIGEYNILDTAPGTPSGNRGSYVFIIGNGTSNSNRSNALTVDWDGYISCNNIDCGQVNITPTANTPSSVQVTFSKPFKTAPVVVATAISKVPGEKITEVSVNTISTTGCLLWIYRNTNENTTINWIAIGK